MIYTTISGDTWDYIAFKTLGSERYTSLLMEVNTKFINTTVFNAGVELTIPVIKTPTPASLPPWKR